jgi:hypothetical protein
MDVEQRFVIFPLEKTRLQADARGVGCKLWEEGLHIRFREIEGSQYDGGRRYSTDLSRTGRLPSDIAEAVSKVLNE